MSLKRRLTLAPVDMMSSEVSLQLIYSKLFIVYRSLYIDEIRNIQTYMYVRQTLHRKEPYISYQHVV